MALVLSDSLESCRAIETLKSIEKNEAIGEDWPHAAASYFLNIVRGKAEDEFGWLSHGPPPRLRVRQP